MDTNETLLIPSTIATPYPVRMSLAVQEQFHSDRGALLSHISQVSSIMNEVAKLDPSKTYGVVIDSELLNRLSEGTARFGARGDLFSANIHDAQTGKILSQVSLEEINPDIANQAYQLVQHVSVQVMLSHILVKLELLDEKLSMILRGQQEDRYAEIDAGIDLYEQAMHSQKKENRDHLLHHCIESLVRGRAKCERQLGTYLRWISHNSSTDSLSFFSNYLVPGNDEYLIDIALAIQEGFFQAFRGSHMLCLAHLALGEENAALQSLQPMRKMVRKFGKKGRKAARLLPYDSSNPPERVWGRAVKHLAKGLEKVIEIEQAQHFNAIAITFSPRELVQT